MIYQITPVPKPRMTQRDKWKQRPAVLRYQAFCDEVRMRKVRLPESGLEVSFILPMPKSWSKKKREEMNGVPHKQKPDLDNCLKSLMDAVYGEDCGVWEITARKLWGDIGLIEITGAAA